MNDRGECPMQRSRLWVKSLETHLRRWATQKKKTASVLVSVTHVWSNNNHLTLPLDNHYHLTTTTTRRNHNHLPQPQPLDTTTWCNHSYLIPTLQQLTDTTQSNHNHLTRPLDTVTTIDNHKDLTTETTGQNQTALPNGIKGMDPLKIWKIIQYK